MLAGWMNPYLFASARRPVVPRSMNPDVIFAHGPFLRGKSRGQQPTRSDSFMYAGDYKIGQTLLNHSASVVTFEGRAFINTDTDTDAGAGGGGEVAGAVCDRLVV